MYRNKKAVAAPPAALELESCTFHTRAVSIAKQAAIAAIQLSKSFRLPKESMRNHGIKDATKNQVNSAPARSAGLSETRARKFPASNI
jgi:hypothetical protein